MVVLTNTTLERITLPVAPKPSTYFSGIPVINLAQPGSETLLVRACEELGFFKVTNHGIPMELIARLEEEAVKFFSLAQVEKERAGTGNPFGYGNKTIGHTGDVGWVEYLLFDVTSKPMSHTALAFLEEPSASSLCSALNEYVSAMRKLVCEVLELMAEGLRVQPRNILSKLVMDEESDSILRLNHYPPCPHLPELDSSLTGFGEHTDPQIISILRSNNTSGLQIYLRDGSWVTVPPDQDSFFINVGDSLQVLTNGRFRSVKHRVLAHGLKSRVSMIYFGGPPSGERLAPLPLLMGEGEESLYREFTWCEYKSFAHGTRLTDNRLGQFQR
uniref:gibberellin 2beta-dioxygenase n=1 Tax=Elaeis guineensis var. tenera TaxID=51953 RepID=B3TLX1_ELAGV